MNPYRKGNDELERNTLLGMTKGHIEYLRTKVEGVKRREGDNESNEFVFRDTTSGLFRTITVRRAQELIDAYDGFFSDDNVRRCERITDASASGMLAATLIMDYGRLSSFNYWGINNAFSEHATPLKAAVGFLNTLFFEALREIHRGDDLLIKATVARIIDGAMTVSDAVRGSEWSVQTDLGDKDDPVLKGLALFKIRLV